MAALQSTLHCLPVFPLFRAIVWYKIGCIFCCLETTVAGRASIFDASTTEQQIKTRNPK